MSREIRTTVRGINTLSRADTATLTIEVPAHEAAELLIGEQVVLTVPDGWTPASIPKGKAL